MPNIKVYLYLKPFTLLLARPVLSSRLYAWKNEIYSQRRDATLLRRIINTLQFSWVMSCSADMYSCRMSSMIFFSIFSLV